MAKKKKSASKKRANRDAKKGVASATTAKEPESQSRRPSDEGNGKEKEFMGSLDGADDVPVYEEIMARLPPRPECPLCMLTLPFSPTETACTPCCGTRFCFGCNVQDLMKRGGARGPVQTCPFCREPAEPKRIIALCQMRADKHNDVNSIEVLADHYLSGEGGVLARNEKKATELLIKAAEMGSAEAAGKLSNYYKHDPKKEEYYLRLSADLGDVICRYNLSRLMFKRGQHKAALVHCRLAASFGAEPALEDLKREFKLGHVSKDDLASALRMFQKAQEDMNSKDRQLARHCLQKIKERGYIHPLVQTM